MGTGLLALGFVAIAVGSFLFYKMKVMVASHATEQKDPVASARVRALALLVVGAALTAGSIPANLLASSAAMAPSPSAQSSASAAPSNETSSVAASSTATATPTPTPTSTSTSTATPPRPAPARNPGKPAPRKK